jgi:hypothetical protein
MIHINKEEICKKKEEIYDYKGREERWRLHGKTFRFEDQKSNLAPLPSSA